MPGTRYDAVLAYFQITCANGHSVATEVLMPAGRPIRLEAITAVFDGFTRKLGTEVEAFRLITPDMYTSLTKRKPMVPTADQIRSLAMRDGWPKKPYDEKDGT